MPPKAASRYTDLILNVVELALLGGATLAYLIFAVYSLMKYPLSF